MITLIPLLQSLLMWVSLALAVTAVVVGAYLYCALKVELGLLSRRSVARAEADVRWTGLVAELEALRARLAAVEARAAPSDWAPQAVNLNRRGQVLRLHGKGRSTAEIAADLQIAQGEVELLLKLHEWPPAASL